MKVDFDQVLYADRYELRNRAVLGKWRNLLSAIRCLFFTSYRFPAPKSIDYVFFRSLVRDDYKVLFRKISSTVDDSKKAVIDDYIKEHNRIAPKGIAFLFLKLPSLFKFKADSTFERIYLYLRLCFYYRQISALSKFDFKVLVLFSDMQPVENLAAQHFQQRGKTTVTLQHGLYADYKDFLTINTINYLHQPSEYFLSWGRDTADLIKKYHPHRKTVICGKPISHHTVSPQRLAGEKRYITVVLDQNIFQSYNIAMLKILSEYSKNNSLQLNVRYHPYNQKRVYEGLKLNFRADLPLEGSAFVVGHTSSMLHEVMLLDIPVLKFASDVPCVNIPDALVFSSLQEVDYAIQESFRLDFKALSKKYISCSSEESLQQYSHFFRCLLTAK